MRLPCRSPACPFPASAVRSYRFWWWLTIVAACMSGWLEPYQIGFLEPSLK
jgi:hypothetical protein